MDTDFTPRRASGWTFAALGALAVGAALHQGNPALFACGVLLAGLPLVVWQRLRGSASALRIVRYSPPRATEGDEVEVRLELRNDSTWPLYCPEVRDLFVPEIHAHKPITFSGRLLPGERVGQSYTGTCILPRGVYRVGPSATRATDPFGLFEVSVARADETPIKVYPQLYRFHLPDRLGRTVSRILDDRTRRGVGDSREFHTVREYRWGDDPRRIHWPSTARRGVPVVREYARTAAGDIAVLLDSHVASLVGWGRSSSVEYGVKIAAAVADGALRARRRVRIAWGSDDGVQVCEGQGPRDLSRLLDALVEFRARRREGTLPEVAARAAGALCRGGTAVLLVYPNLFGSRALGGLLDAMRGRGQLVKAVLFEGRQVGPAQELARCSAVQFAAELRRRGVESFAVACGEPLEQVFPEARPRRRRRVSAGAPAEERS